MLSLLRRIALILATTGCGAALSAPSAEIPALRLCWENTEKPPYLSTEKTGGAEGISVELVNAVLQRAGLRAQSVVWPWKRCLAEVATGNIDLVPNASRAPERMQYALYSKPLYRTHMAFFYDPRRMPTPPRIETLADLKAFRVGGVLGFNYVHLKGVPLDTGAKSREALLRKLESGRIDLADEQLEVMLEAIRRLELPAAHFAYVRDPFLDAKDFHILINKQHPQAEALRERLDAAIGELERDGTLGKINARATAPRRP